MQTIKFNKVSSALGMRLSYNFHRIFRNESTAGIIVIGDEVLKGQVYDTNSNFLARELYQRGYRLRQIQVVPDHIQTISNVLRHFSEQFDVVITTGGIGPTHDDVTYEALAVAFGQKLHYHPKILNMCREFFQTEDENHPGMKLALVPISAKLTYGINPATGQKALYPNVAVENVYVFPGVPHLCEKMFQMTKNIIFPVADKFFDNAVFLDTTETDITGILNEAVQKFPTVAFGSYPNFTHSYYSVKITLQSLDETDMINASSFIKQNMKGVAPYDPNCFTDKESKLDKLNNPLVQEIMRKLRAFLSGVSLENVYLYFDGGKNATLLLHIFSVIYDEKNTEMNLIYVENNRNVSDFVVQSARNYKANLIKLSQLNLKRFLVSDKDIVLVKGTRMSDPHFRTVSKEFSDLSVYNPISDWSYSNVWAVVRALSLPYCKLYDRGYSSLHGSRNSLLEISGPRKDIKYFKRAHLLEDRFE